MRRKSVESSNIASVGYKKQTKTLEIRFNNGGVYQYKDVTDDVYEAFNVSESKGKFFHSNIKGKFDFERVK